MQPARLFRLRLAMGIVLVAGIASGMGRDARAQTRSVLLPAQAFPKLAPWIGEYRASQAGPANAAASRYTVAICDQTGRAYVKVESPMAEIQMTAWAREHRGKVDIYFDPYGESATQPRRYQPDDLLLTLMRRQGWFEIRWGILEAESHRKMSPAEKVQAGCSPKSPPNN
jgi:hypothetical protein